MFTSFIFQGQGKAKSAARADFTFRPDAAAVGIDNLFGNIESQPCPPPYSFAFDAIESFKKVGYGFLFNASAVVNNLEKQFIVLYCDLNVNTATGVAEFNGIAQQVDNDLA